MAPPKKQTTTKAPMSDDHKVALAQGRTQSRVVRQYLETLEAAQRRGGRRRSPESINARIEVIIDALPGAGPMEKLELVQEKIDLETQLAQGDVPIDLSGAEEEFTAVAKAYADRKGISYAAWRAVGVPAATLKRAGISRAHQV